MKSCQEQPCCQDCCFFINEPGRVEQAVPGLAILSSAYASVRADAGLCSRREIFLSPWNRCRDFEPRS